MAGIRGYGSYVPLYRITHEALATQHGRRGREREVAVPSHDEDVVTMAVAALKEALTVARDDVDLDAVYVATTSDPFDERGIAPHVAHAVGADGDVRVADFQGTPRAVTTALTAARDAIEAGSAETVAVVATDVLSAPAGSDAELTAGAGAGALVLGSDGDVGTFTAGVSNTTGFVGRFAHRETGPVTGDTQFHRDEGFVDAVTDTLVTLASRCPREFSPERYAMTTPDPRWVSSAVEAISIDCTHDTTFDAVGYAGAGSLLLDAALALERATEGQQLFLLSYGPGGCDALSVETGPGVERTPETTTSTYLESKSYVSYAAHRRYRARARGTC
ncbi:hypothetical protein [Natronobeatus ordinarius]|uniref:hypothetical protein n=1 Tax=Natronobeatus ordinarius TaxID=2963433 RepID=UPI0020CD9D97|nr:hypothetical protein [Natronobeatus ordinarius]